MPPPTRIAIHKDRLNNDGLLDALVDGAARAGCLSRNKPGDGMAVRGGARHAGASSPSGVGRALPASASATRWRSASRFCCAFLSSRIVATATLRTAVALALVAFGIGRLLRQRHPGGVVCAWASLASRTGRFWSRSHTALD